MENILNQFLKEFGGKVRKERESKNLTLQDMEFNTGIDFSDFNKIEQGKTNLTFRTFIKIAKGLGIHPKELLNFDFEIKEDKNEN